VNVIRFSLLGLGAAGVYAVMGIGLVLVHRASGVVNFAAGAMGCVAAFVFYDLRDNLHFNAVLALLIATALGGAIGGMTHVFVMARLRHASALTRLVASLGVLSILEGVALLKWGSDVNVVTSVLPTTTINFTSTLNITEDQLILAIASVVIGVALKLVYSRTKFGLATSAVAENRRAAASSGWSTDRIELLNWIMGGMLSALAAIFIAGIVGLTVSTLVLLVLPAIAAALIGGFNSFLLTFLGALIIGVIESLGAVYVQTSGVATSVPFVVIIIFVVLGGNARPTRSDLPSRLPLPGDGRVNVPLLVVSAGFGLVLIWTLNGAWLEAILTTFIFAIAILSVVVVTGFGGQLSLAQWALAGTGAWFASRLVVSANLPFWLAVILGVAATIPVGLLIALPALRTRGVNLAIVTLGLSEVIISIVFDSSSLTGGLGGVNIGTPHIFGLDIDNVNFPARYTTFALILLVCVGVMVANVRRGMTGRRLLAIRSDERAAAATGIGVYGAKLYAFGLASGIAAIAGVLAAFQTPVVVFTQFDLFSNINLVMFAVIGGVGWASGSIPGATLVSGSIVAIIFTQLGTDINEYLAPISGITLILTLILAPNGVAEVNKKTFGPKIARTYARFRSIFIKSETHSVDERRALVNQVRPSSRPKSIEIDGLTVRYGGVLALDKVSMRVDPGEVVGLIGPNGAGKTTLLDAVTGFVKPSSGDVKLGDTSIRGWSPVKVSRAGIARSFQAVQLFDSMTVRDNLLVAIDPSSWSCYAADLVHPGRTMSYDFVEEIIDDFDLRDVLDELPSVLPHGTARLVGVARALLTMPSVLFLDEPAAGLDPAERARIGPMIRQIARDRQASVVLVEHDVPLVLGSCDRVVVLDFGHEIASGNPETIRIDPNVIAAYLGESIDYPKDRTTLEAPPLVQQQPATD
jgi:ABC-type branched-subunit amino acid transport system ATPase component/branched-subunit amino acid ABC-type transport system permease component